MSGKKPSITTKPVAGQYDGPGGRTIEYSSSNGRFGGLICFREDEDGNLAVDLYRHDEGVTINVGKAG